MKTPTAIVAAVSAVAVWAMLAAPCLAAAPNAETKPPASVQEVQKAQGKPAPESPVVAVVNGTRISRSDFDRALRANLQNLRAMGANAEASEEIKKEVVDQLVDRELLYQESRKYPDEDQAKKVEEQLKGIEARFPSPEAFQEALKAQNLTEKELHGLLDKQVSVQHYVDTQVTPKTEVAEGEVKKFYEDNIDKFASPEQVKASHILIRVQADAKPDEKAKAKAKAEELRKRAAAGEDFAKLARENSEDPGSAPNGGDLGFFTKDRMVKPFADAAFALKVGEVSGVVETQFGYHVIKVTDRKEAGTVGFDEVKDRISSYLKAKALDEAVRARIDKLRATAKIETMEP